MKENRTIRENIAENISFYRKKMDLTQVQLADKLNYSDKLVSSWERGERVPDIDTLKALSDIFGISIDVLISEKKIKFVSKVRKQTIAYFFAMITLVIYALVFAFLNLFHVEYDYWHFIIFALATATLVLFIFNIVYKKIWFVYIYGTIFIWTSVLSLSLLLPLHTGNIFISAAPIYVFVMFLMYILIHAPLLRLKKLKTK